MSTPCTSVTGLYGARSVVSPFGAWIVTHSCSRSMTDSPAHQLGWARAGERQYENCSEAGSKWLHHGSSAPFHIATAGSASSAETTFCSNVSLGAPAVARLTVLRLTH